MAETKGFDRKKGKRVPINSKPKPKPTKEVKK